MNGIPLFFKDACEEFSIKTKLKSVEQQSDGWEPQRYRLQHDSCALDQITGTPLTLLVNTLSLNRFYLNSLITRFYIIFPLIQYLHESSVFTALSALHSKTVFPMTLKRRQKLQSAQSRFESTISLPN